MARLMPIMVLLLIVSLATPALGRSAMDAYGDALDAMHGSRAVTAAAADDDIDVAAEMKALVAYATQQLNLAKAELRQLEAVYRLAMRELKGDAHECERERLTSIYAAERARLQSRIRDYRRIRGDRRGFFTKAWHSIGPAGRRIARAIGDGALDIVASGGTLGGGAARRLLISAGRNELQGAALRAVARNVQGRAAVATAAASSACDGDEVDPDAIDEEAPAIPPGTYVGTFDMDLSADALVSRKVTEANEIELEVDEQGRVSGSFAHWLSGVWDGHCQGHTEGFEGTVDPGQRIGPELPQTIDATANWKMIIPVVDFDVNAVEYVCGTNGTPFYDETASYPMLVIEAYDDGAITGGVPDNDSFELQWVP